MKPNKKLVSFLTIIVILLELGQIRAFAQVSAPGTGYRVGAGDKLYMAVPQRSDLNRELVVKSNGSIELPLIGDVHVAGLTSTEIELRIYQALKELYPSVTRVEVTVVEASGHVVYVIGQVETPGRYSFVSAPNLWEVIREAGGPLPGASLDHVRIVKDRSKGGTSTTVNVQQALEYGTVDNLPDLEGGDTVIIPQSTEMYTGPFGVSVFGAVLNPGAYRLDGRKDLVSAILLAGGPTEIASLDRIKIIRQQSDGSITTIEVDLKEYFENGDPMSNPPLQASDTVHVPEKNRFIHNMKSGTLIFSIITAGVSIAALIIAAQ
ncbi:MAG: hypothetical protein GTO51_06780 [Candidatus Latescibacteria bacterium]|nr:hypothetical protein [Candidatus Latescibacterota bacterium]NIM21508.1 hypothetical protein [Candidatus Latescibacterota bacterium]NIM65679.1 hypothetical protein [Candidatus Latescibacterota bacterium]NIO02061.1 hypothetical protein [Candidatus Latescibacterota bacterium]NIO28873.1 hypothetical protein [Candidatus Latescibacterota bacterium]